MMNLMTYSEACTKGDHLRALGHTEVWLERDATDLPWDKVVRVEEGNGYRLSGPTGARMVAEHEGLTFFWSVDFEGRDANGRGVSLFERDRLRDVITKLPPPARSSFGKFLSEKVLPGLAERTAECRKYLNQQWDSEDCVRGLIAFSQSA